MSENRIYLKLLKGLKKGLREGRVYGQSFRDINRAGHTLDTILNEYVICGGTKGNMLNYMDEKFETDDYFSSRMDGIQTTCVCGKKELCENIFITRFDPSSKTGVNKKNPILAIGTNCQNYFSTIDEKKIQIINQKNKRENTKVNSNQNDNKRKKIKELHFEVFDSDEEFEDFEISSFSPSCFFDEESKVYGGGHRSQLRYANRKKTFFHETKTTQKKKQLLQFVDSHDDDDDDEEYDSEDELVLSKFKASMSSSSSSYSNSSSSLSTRKKSNLIYLSSEDEDQDSSSDYEEEEEEEEIYEKGEGDDEEEEEEEEENNDKRIEENQVEILPLEKTMMTQTEDETKEKEIESLKSASIDTTLTAVSKLYQLKCKLAKYYKKIAKLQKQIAQEEHE